jgi:hypothetical protein
MALLTNLSTISVQKCALTLAWTLQSIAARSAPGTMPRSLPGTGWRDFQRCHIFAHGNNNYINQWFMEMSQTLPTILSTDYVQNSAMSMTKSMTDDGVALVALNLDHARYQPASSPDAYNTNLGAAGRATLLPVRHRQARSSIQTGVRFVCHFSSCRLAYLAIADRVHCCDGADSRAFAIPAAQQTVAAPIAR